jgi:hypothetical protein
MPDWHWLIHSDAGLAIRIAIGATIFIALALLDLRKHGRRATRWREYAFLLFCTTAAMAYGALNNQVTAAISWEYFYYGKELYLRLGSQTPPEPVMLHLHAALIGIKATWSAGLIVGVCLLLANNPSPKLPKLRYPSLARHAVVILVVTITCAAIGGFLGYRGLPARWNDEFAEMLRQDQMRPRPFIAAYGVHCGAYLGGAIGTVLTVIRIRRRRFQQTPAEALTGGFR